MVSSPDKSSANNIAAARTLVNDHLRTHKPTIWSDIGMLASRRDFRELPVGNQLSIAKLALSVCANTTTVNGKSWGRALTTSLHIPLHETDEQVTVSYDASPPRPGAVPADKKRRQPEVKGSYVGPRISVEVDDKIVGLEFVERLRGSELLHETIGFSGDQRIPRGSTDPKLVADAELAVQVTTDVAELLLLDWFRLRSLMGESILADAQVS